MDSFVLLCFSIFHSFLCCHSFSFFPGESHYSLHPPHFSQIHCICPCSAKGKRKPILSKWNSISFAHKPFFLLLFGRGGIATLFYNIMHRTAVIYVLIMNSISSRLNMFLINCSSLQNPVEIQEPHLFPPFKLDYGINRAG